MTVAELARKKRRVKKKKKVVCKTKVKRLKNGKKVKTKSCPKPKKRKAVKKPAAKKKIVRRVPLAKPPAAAPVAKAPAAVVPAPVPVPAPTPASPLAVYSGSFGVREAERLLWRAGCGPSPGHAQALAGLGLRGAVASLTRPAGAAVLTGAAPTDGDGPLEPSDAWGHDHLWFLDRMVRTNQPLVERMTLIWHDWFATSIASVDQRLMIDQNQLFRFSALGSFPALAKAVTQDPAMLLWLNGVDNRRNSINENYARELMELFTLGADRGAYSETDVRQLARCLTGWRSDWSAELGNHNFRYDATRHDTGQKTVFGATGNFGWEDGVRMCVEHPLHASFFVKKLWSYFIPTPPSAGDLNTLAATYVSSGRQIRPVVEAILLHPDLHAGPRMVKPPVIYVAGMLRQQRRTIDRSNWIWYAEASGQRLFAPPNVAGWDETRWLDTSTLRARWLLAASAMQGVDLTGSAIDNYDGAETPAQAVNAALAFLGDPPLTAAGRARLETFAAACVNPTMPAWQQRQQRGVRQNAMRMLLLTSPDLQTA